MIRFRKTFVDEPLETDHSFSLVAPQMRKRYLSCTCYMEKLIRWSERTVVFEERQRLVVSLSGALFAAQYTSKSGKAGAQ